MGKPKGWHHSPETREKMRLAHLGQPLSPQHCEKIAQAHQTLESREKNRQATIRRCANPEVREKMRQVQLGKHLSPEHREKMRQAHRGKKQSPEARAKIRQAVLVRMASPEAREKVRQATLGRRHSAMTREKLRRIQQTPEAREKMRQVRLRQRRRLTDIEVILYGEFKKRRLHFETHKAMFGKWQPDFVFEDAKLIVQADGGYWHNRRTRPDMAARDDAFNAEAAAQGWTVFRFSDTQIKIDAAACARAVARFVRDHH
jgi:very-short-patch-repair endonuclease